MCFAFSPLPLKSSLCQIIVIFTYILQWNKFDNWDSIVQGRIQDFKLGGAHLKKSRRAEGGAKIVGVFRVKNHDFTPKNHIFSNFRGGARRVRPPWIRPWYVYIFIAIVKQIIKRGRVVIQSNCLTLKQVCVRILTLSVPDEDYSRHASCTWN